MCKKIDFAIQALALNERRKAFQPTVWRADPGTDLKQCWFLGAHSDVGGGNEDTGLANLALVWMIAQLDKHIHFDRQALYHLASDQGIETDNTVTHNTSSREFSVQVPSAVLGGPLGASLGYSATVVVEGKLGRVRQATGMCFSYQA